MDIEERLTNFEKAYDIVFSENLSDGNKIFIGSKENCKCRFCGKSEPEVAFKSIAHAIPESIGNSRIILLNECDQCNSYFSMSLEDSFDKYTKPYRLLFGIKGKKKVPSYKTRDKSARVDVQKKERLVKIDDDQQKIIKSESGNSLKVKFEREPYIPLNVYKALLKMALSVVDSKYLCQLEEHIRWLLQPDYDVCFFSPYYLVERLSYGASFNGDSYAMLFIRKQNIPQINPFMIFFISFGSMTFQIPIPESSETIASVPLFPIPSEEPSDKFRYKQIVKDLSSNEVFKHDDLTFGMSQLQT